MFVSVIPGEYRYLPVCVSYLCIHSFRFRPGGREGAGTMWAGVTLLAGQGCLQARWMGAERRLANPLCYLGEGGEIDKKRQSALANQKPPQTGRPVRKAPS